MHNTICNSWYSLSFEQGKYFDEVFFLYFCTTVKLYIYIWEEQAQGHICWRCLINSVASTNILLPLSYIATVKGEQGAELGVWCGAVEVLVEVVVVVVGVV